MKTNNNNIKIIKKDNIKNRELNNDNKHKKKFLKNNNSKLSPEKNNKIPKIDKKKYQKALLYKCNPKNSQSMKDIIKINNPNIIFKPLGLYGNLFNGGGGFSKKICTTNYNNIIIQLENADILGKKLAKCISSSNIKSDINNNGFKLQNNAYIDNKNRHNSSKSNHKKNSKSINNKSRDTSKKKKMNKINIKEVYKNINYLKLDNKVTNNDDDDNPQIEQKEKEPINIQENKNNNKNNNRNNNKNNKNNSNKKNSNNNKNNNNKTYTYKNREKTFENQNINLNELSMKKCLNETKSFTKLTKQSNEQFSMNNNNIKKFNKLTEEYNILINYHPSFNIPHNNQKNNYSISSNQIEYKITKQQKQDQKQEQKQDQKQGQKQEQKQEKKQDEKQKPKKPIIQNKYFIPTKNDIPKSPFTSKLQPNKDTSITDNEVKINKIHKSKDAKNIEGIMNKNKDNKNENKVTEKKVKFNSNQVNNNTKNEKDEMENKGDNDVNKNAEKKYETKNSKQFLKFKEKLVKKNSSDLKNEGDKCNVSEKISNMALELEKKLNNKKDVNIENDIKQEIENKINSADIIEEKPASYKKKKKEKTEFIFN